MLEQFESYTEIQRQSIEFCGKLAPTIKRKQELLDAVSTNLNNKPETVLFIGFSPALMANKYKSVFVTGISEDTKNYLDVNSVKYTYIDDDDLGNYQKGFDWIIALDEFFTFALNDNEQRTLIGSLLQLTNGTIVTSLRDYKNQPYKEKEFSFPLAAYNVDSYRLYLEYHKYDFLDKNKWESLVHVIDQEGIMVAGPFDRYAMYFKQLAKVSSELGATEFKVHKNLMYKSLIRKNYEHVITLSV